MCRSSRFPFIRLLAPAAFLILSIPAGGHAYTKEAVPFGDEALGGMGDGCLLQSYNVCSGWVWLFTDVPGAVWGTVFDPADCPGGCESGGSITDIWLYTQCSTFGEFGGVAVSRVDESGCLLTPLFDSGPFTTVHCLPGDRWQRIQVPLVYVDGAPFAVTVEWFGAGHLAGDTILDDLCALYGHPYPLAFPEYGSLGSLPNNLILKVRLDCVPPHTPTELCCYSNGLCREVLHASCVGSGGRVVEDCEECQVTARESTSWGRVKSLYR